MSLVLLLLWWIVLPILFALIASVYVSGRTGVSSWPVTIIASVGGLVLNSTFQTYDVCGLTLGEMSEDLGRNCTYASNTIGETFKVHLFFAGILFLVTFIISFSAQKLDRPVKQ